MITNFITYDKKTGRAISSGFMDDSLIFKMETEDVGVIASATPMSYDSCYVDLKTLKVVSIEKPPSPSYVFNTYSKEWLPDGEMLANEMRLKRDNLLVETDWSQLPDVPDTLKQEYATYRQHLRDITDQPRFPYNIDWPTKPEI
jgi:hypothetical protein